MFSVKNNQKLLMTVVIIWQLSSDSVIKITQLLAACLENPNRSKCWWLYCVAWTLGICRIYTHISTFRTWTAKEQCKKKNNSKLIQVLMIVLCCIDSWYQSSILTRTTVLGTLLFVGEGSCIYTQRLKSSAFLVRMRYESHSVHLYFINVF